MSDGLVRESRVIDSVDGWLDQRRAHVTASRVGALWDQHPYMNRDDLAGELRGTGRTPDNGALRRGRILEAGVIEALKEQHPDWTIERARTYHWLPEHRLGATPDAFYNDDGLIECKTVHPRKWDEWHGRPPLQHLLQTLTGLMVTGRTQGLLACMVLTSDYPVYEFTVERHPEAEQRILGAVRQWWEEYDQGRIAAPQSAAEIEALLDDGSHLDLSGNNEIRELLEMRRALKSEASIAAHKLGEVELKIKEMIGAASTAYLPGWSIVFKRTQRREYTVPATDVRTLRVKEISIE